MPFQLFDWPTRKLAALITMAVLCCSTSWAQHAHSQPNGPADGTRKPRPQLGVGVAFSPDGSLWLAGLDTEGRLFVQSAALAVGIEPIHWSAPRILNIGGDAISADGENRPKIAFGPRGWMVISYTQPLAKPYTGMIRMLRSTDGGHTFSEPFTVHANRQEITHRFESIGFDAQRVLHTVWIDKRDLELTPTVGKKSSYQGAAIFRNESHDGGATFGPDIKLADHSCECCSIALSRGSDGLMRAMWRHVFESNVRDHGFAVMASGQPQKMSKVVRATFDDWHIDACPHQGPGLALAAEGGFHAVWFGIRKQNGEDVAAVRYARLQSDGSPRLETVRALPDDQAEHAEVLSSGLRVAVVWRSVEGELSTLKAWQSSDNGQTFRLVILGQVSGDNDHPHLAQKGEHLVAVWRNSKEVQVHELHF